MLTSSNQQVALEDLRGLSVDHFGGYTIHGTGCCGLKLVELP